MASGELIASATWFSVLTALCFVVGYYLFHRRYVTYGRQQALVDGSRRYRTKRPEDWDSDAVIMSGEQILTYLVPQMPVPPALAA